MHRDHVLNLSKVQSHKAWSLTHIGPLPLVPLWLAPLFRPFQAPAKDIVPRSENGPPPKVAIYYGIMGNCLWILSYIMAIYYDITLYYGKNLISPWFLAYRIFRQPHITGKKMVTRISIKTCVFASSWHCSFNVNFHANWQNNVALQLNLPEPLVD